MAAYSGNVTRGQTLLLAVVVGATVANIYYIQPLLPTLASYFSTSASGIGKVAMLTQLGTAAGMLVFVPMGDTHQRRSLAFWLLIASTVALTLFASAQNVFMLALAGMMIGLTASAVHVLVPFAAHLAPADQKGSAIGVVLSGLLLGILLARTVSGYICQWLDWRAVYILASGFMVIAAIGVRAKLPSQKPDVRLSWIKLMSSAWALVRQQPVVRDATLISALLFFAFSAFWTTLAFFLAGDHYTYGAAAVGNFGLVGAVGALAAPLLGRLADRFSARRNVLMTVLITSISFVVMGLLGNHLAGLIAGVLLLDIGMQGTHVSNQTRIYAVLPEAKSRMNMVYMFAYFFAGAMGSLAGAKVWQRFGWTGVCSLGFVATLAALVTFATFTAPIHRYEAQHADVSLLDELDAA
jgi:predicted MFS family arabinose efflux permease